MNIAAPGDASVLNLARDCGEGIINAVFETEVLLEGDVLVFVPSPREFEDAMDAFVDKYLESVSSRTRLLGSDRLSEYTVLYTANSEVGSDIFASVSDNVSNDDEFKHLCEGLKIALSDAFDLAEACRLSYEPFLHMVTHNRSVHPNELKIKVEQGN
jgi:hypothetical protein